MQFAGVLPEDAPDPRTEIDARLRSLPFSVTGFKPQLSLEDHGSVSLQESGDQQGPWQLSASVTYTLWRNPTDREDPVNLAELDENARAAIEDEPPWPRPAWLIEMVQRGRYPQLWEAVRTTWTREAWEYSTLSCQLTEHTNYILINQFREVLGMPAGPPDSQGNWRVHESAVHSAAPVCLDGEEVPAAEIDTDPFVYAIGFHVTADVVATAVIPREHLPYLSIEFATRAL